VGTNSEPLLGLRSKTSLYRYISVLIMLSQFETTRFAVRWSKDKTAVTKER
jgi:hypothetical protein